MKTAATNDFPEIEWEDLKQKLVETDFDELKAVFICIGKDVNGNTYQGNAYFYADIFEEIKDIDQVK